jgi:hypothetical protein
MAKKSSIFVSLQNSNNFDTKEKMERFFLKEWLSKSEGF